MKFLPTWLYIIVALNASTESSKILSVFQVPSPSHYIFASAILKELAARGHEVTSVNLYPQKIPIANFTDVFIDTNTNIIENFVDNAESGKKQTLWKFLQDFFLITEKLCINLFEHPSFQEILKSPKEKFDLIILEVIATDSLHGLREYFNVPVIGVSTFGTSLDIDKVVGNTSPASIIPYAINSYTSKMNFLQRVNNFIDYIVAYYLLYFQNYYIQKNIYEKYFPKAQLSFEEASKDFALLILNQHHSLSYPRPYVPNVIECGGLHIPHKPATLQRNQLKF